MGLVRPLLFTVMEGLVSSPTSSEGLFVENKEEYTTLTSVSHRVRGVRVDKPRPLSFKDHQ